MQRVYFPFQLSRTSYKLKSSLPYQVSLSILGNMHNIGNTVFKKKKKKKERNRGETRRKGKRCKHLEQLCFWKGHLCRAPTEFPSLKVLFINVYNNSLEGKYKSAAEGGGVCLGKLRLQRWGSEEGGGQHLRWASPHPTPISLLIISERNLSYCQCLRTLNIIRPTWRQIS